MKITPNLMRIVTFKDVNVEEVQKTDIDIPDSM